MWDIPMTDPFWLKLNSSRQDFRLQQIYTHIYI